MNGELDYWRDRVAELPALELPTDRPHMPGQLTEVATVGFGVPAPTAQRLRALADERGVTLPHTMLAALSVLIGRYTRSDDVAVVAAGIADAARGAKGSGPGSGSGSGVTVQRADLSGDPTFAELLERMRRGGAGGSAAVDDADGGLESLSEDVLRSLAAERSGSRSPLFQVYFGYVGAEGQGDGLSGGLESEFDLVVRVRDGVRGGAGGGVGDEGLVGEVQYSTALFDAATVERLAGHLVSVLEAVAVGDAGQRVGELSVLSVGEREELVGGGVGEVVVLPSVGGVHELIAE
ncbi:condensation domain-containing protein, partial [Streptomyces sp. NPDC091292]|uniref:condensation domain-containing protein n=1 Tax=Streptomyces sp. NPDC091292 TaxID=3365991 RepID=UPI00381ACB9B